jgi:hypothetical protein
VGRDSICPLRGLALGDLAWRDIILLEDVSLVLVRRKEVLFENVLQGSTLLSCH